MRKACLAIMLHRSSVHQHVPVLKIRMAEMESSGFDKLQRRDRCVADAGLTAQFDGRRAKDGGKRLEFSHQIPCKRIGVAALIACIKKHLEKLEFAECAGYSFKKLRQNAGAVP